MLRIYGWNAKFLVSMHSCINPVLALFWGCLLYNVAFYNIYCGWEQLWKTESSSFKKNKIQNNCYWLVRCHSFFKTFASYTHQQQRCMANANFSNKYFTPKCCSSSFELILGVLKKRFCFVSGLRFYFFWHSVSSCEFSFFKFWKNKKGIDFSYFVSESTVWSKILRKSDMGIFKKHSKKNLPPPRQVSQKKNALPHWRKEVLKDAMVNHMAKTCLLPL